MKYPNIEIRSNYSKEQFTNWIEEQKNLHTPQEARDINAIILPIAKRAASSKLVVKTLKQVPNYNIYKRIVVIGCYTPKIYNGIYTTKTLSYQHNLTEFESFFGDDLIGNIENLHLEGKLNYNVYDIIEESEMIYTLPLISEFTKEYNLPIIPVLYHNAELSDLFKLFELLHKDKTLLIICSDLSHSLSVNETKSLDSVTISKIIAQDYTVTNQQCTAYTALNSFIRMSYIHYWRPRIVSYQSTETQVNVTNTTGFASVVFYK